MSMKVMIEMAPPRLVVCERSVGTFLKISRLRTFLLKSMMSIGYKL